MIVRKIIESTNWFENGLPDAFAVAPWQKANLETDTMYPDKTKKIHYKLNSKGYRDVEWTDADLNDSIWCVGHSDVFGIGVHERETWARLVDGVNLGIAGAGWDTLARIVCSGLSQYKPKCIVIQSTTKERKEYITKDFHQVVLPSMPAALLPHDDVWTYCDDTTFDYNYEKNLALIKAVCEAKSVPLILFEFKDRWGSISNDPAVDGQHIGPSTHQIIANFVKQELQKLQNP